ncbi:conserved hypothetical protein [Verrucomicrobia bacterium]|nr:conserved hypothetical protein [Verrucomicrobiota bacterium]
MTEWKIQSRAHACEACGKAFADQETYHTILFDEKADFRRSDVCQPCWQKQYSDGARERKGFVSYWHGVYQSPPPTTEAIQKETAESLLRKLIEINDPNYIPVAYILAVMLERKRLLKVKEQSVREAHRVFVYEQPRTGDLFTIVDPGLQLNQLESVQHDVASLLEHGLNPTPAAAPLVGSDPGPVAQESPSPSAQGVEPTPVEPTQGTERNETQDQVGVEVEDGCG